MSKLPAVFLSTPIAHRALHDKSAGRPENSLAAVRAAVEAGYGIEIDLQPSSDGVAMVFHDYALNRLTHEKGPIKERTAEELGQIRLRGSAVGDTIPTLREVLEVVAGKVPLLIEIKDQDGALGPSTGALARAAALALEGYEGPVAVMSFNPHEVAAFAEHAPHLPRGLTTDRFRRMAWAGVPKARLKELRKIPDYERLGASFISHRADDLDSARVAELRNKGAGILTWTVKSAKADRAARRHAHNVTFEGYLPEEPAANPPDDPDDPDA